ncbi:MAG: 2-oxo acid dehydrogenase subunit E2 [Geobacter sp.]|nr:2-oxo acid dehydrogenase subunit E2 [Geobacter sp.]
MAADIIMPKLSDTMTEGKLGAWKKSIGDQVQRGDVIAEVETDKAVMELEAFTSGTLLEQRVKPGELVAVGTVIGIVGAPGESAVPGTAIPEAPAVAAPQAEPVSAPTPAPVPDEAVPQPPRHAPAEAEDLQQKAAPVVRRHARELGIDLDQVTGSGPGGRVLLEDLQRFSGVMLSAEPSVAEPSATLAGEQASPEVPQAEGGVVPLSRMRAAIARTVTEAWRTIPHFFVTVEIQMDEVEEVRRELKESGSPLSINDMIVKGTALALARFPMLNASFVNDRIVSHDEINIGMAVSLPDGLLVPVIRGCQALTLQEIAVQSRRLVERARSGRLSEAEMSGGTFTISNMGMFDVTEFAAVIHPPQAGILAVGSVYDGIVVKDGQPVVARLARMTLSADHRLVDGAYAARFLKELKRILKKPVLMLV